MKEITIHTSCIGLAKFLKWAGQAETGGRARAMIAEGVVKVNGRTELRSGRRLLPGDQVEVVPGKQFLVVAAPGGS